jgi:hypothetical protein
VRFEEVVMAGSGCVADRKSCRGIVEVTLDAQDNPGQVVIV